MQRNLKLTLAYDGTDFHGWQVQPGLRTVQGELQDHARHILRHPLEITGSGRTDAGVHARGQVAQVYTTATVSTDAIFRALRSRLPDDILLIDLREVPPSFSAIRSARSKLYRYRIYNRHARPVQHHLQRYTYHCWHALDADRMRAAADHIVGTHDFAAFASKGRKRLTTTRTVFRCDVTRHYDEIHIDVEGGGFLYNMVRNIVGTLIEIGKGRWAPDRIPDILASCDRSQAGPTILAKGLTLQWVRYDLPACRQQSA